MKKSDQLVTLADFSSALNVLHETQTPYCLVGGLAVGLWSEFLLTPKEKSSFDLPVKSKDIDLRAEKNVATILTLQLRNEGATATQVIKRTPKDTEQSFPSFAIPITLPPKAHGEKSMATTIEALSGMPLLDTYANEQKTAIQHNGTTLKVRGFFVLDPCSLMVCKLNAIHTRPPGESDNDRKHATILSIVIPRFIRKSMQRYHSGVDTYHPKTDAQRLAQILANDPWKSLIPKNELVAVLKACQMTDDDERSNGKRTTKSKSNPDIKR